jgi:hypothetical protein
MYSKQKKIFVEYTGRNFKLRHKEHIRVSSNTIETTQNMRKIVYTQRE